MRKLLFIIILFHSVDSAFSQENNIPAQGVKYPILESCMDKSNDTKKISCTQETIAAFLTQKIIKRNICQESEGTRVMIKFTINENGEAVDIEIIRSSCSNTLFKENLVAVFRTLPKFHISSETPDVKRKYMIPITLMRIDNNNDLPNTQN